MYTRRAPGTFKYMSAWWLGVVATSLGGLAFAPLFVVAGVGAIGGLPVIWWRWKRSMLQTFVEHTQLAGEQLQLPSPTEAPASAVGMRDYEEIRRNQKD